MTATKYFAQMAPGILGLAKSGLFGVMSILIIMLPFFSRELCGQHLSQTPQSYLEKLKRQTEKDRLWQSRGWQTLLHYERNNSGWESEIDSPSFFISKMGKTDPKAELYATLNAFFVEPELPDKLELHPQCRYVARYEWLDRNLGFDEDRLPRQNCQDFENWYRQIDPQSVSLIFAEYYVQAPASIFGHTLLRIDSAGRQHSTLLGQAINYAAIVDEESYNPFSFAFRGVFGGYRGVFSIYPYYLAVQGYNDIEVRDMWEYRLNLTDDEISLMIKHLWELKHVQFDYYFFKENCSYHLLSLLEVARPSLNLKNPTAFWTLPADTVKQIVEVKDFVDLRRYRPSIYSKIHLQYELMDDRDREIYYEMSRASDLIYPKQWEMLPKERKAKIFDLLDLYFSFYQDAETIGIQEKVLAQRAELQIVLPDDVLLPAKSPPEKGHGSLTIGIFAGHSNKGKRSLDFYFRPALHDLLDVDAGYLAYSQVEFFSGRARICESNQELELDTITLANIISLVPITHLGPSVSWKLNTSIKRLDSESCSGSGLYFALNPGLGISTDIFDGVLYTFGELSFEMGEHLKTEGQAAAGISIGYVLSFLERFKLHLEGARFYSNFEQDNLDDRGLFGASYHFNKDVGIRVNWQSRNKYHRGLVGVNFHF